MVSKPISTGSEGRQKMAGLSIGWCYMKEGDALAQENPDQYCDPAGTMNFKAKRNVFYTGYS